MGMRTKRIIDIIKENAPGADPNKQRARTPIQGQGEKVTTIILVCRAPPLLGLPSNPSISFPAICSRQATPKPESGVADWTPPPGPRPPSPPAGRTLKVVEGVKGDYGSGVESGGGE